VHDPDQGLRRGGQCNGRECDADELRRDLHLAAKRRAATTLSFKFNEVACCIAMTRHLMDPTFLVFSLAEWKKFSPTEQEVMAKGAQLGAATVRAMAPQREADSLAAVKKLGMKVNDIDVAPLQKAALQAQDELAREFGAESLLTRIRSQ
jgi:TRAP-type C4-dicarboxylate transport system substrate-binding protein